MGTRADFYIKRQNSELKIKDWLGSIKWDGYPEGIDKKILSATNKRTFLELLNEFLKNRKDSVFPKDGWPWCWDNSSTTDYAYVFLEKEKRVTFEEMQYPNMSTIKNPNSDSGFMLLHLK